MLVQQDGKFGDPTFKICLEMTEIKIAQFDIDM